MKKISFLSMKAIFTGNWNFSLLNKRKLGLSHTTFSGKNDTGFTLIELLVIISIIGFLTVAAVFSFNVIRTQSRDAVRSRNVSMLYQSLAMYINDISVYPISSGECLSTSGAGNELLTDKVMVDIPVDPLWPTDVPSDINGNGYAQGDSNNFCYYYAGTEKDYYISYYLESNSKSGSAGIHIMTSAGRLD